ncbi:hypothetical protein AYO46_10725 [Betaproteobacteria bacterium SCGC AG-212-J23]|nr:hypothetical protein AYO46_10725 [Betaproteobacteria bacterium SCGC AG-212-J23]
MACPQTAASEYWWVPLVSVVIGAIVGFGISELRERLQRKRQRTGHLEALTVEVSVCGDLAQGYCIGKVMAPAYRMPLLAYQRVFPELVSAGILNSTETNALMRFFFNAAAFNFALDQAQAVLMKKSEDRPPNRLELETRRAMLKAQKLAKGGTSNHYTAAIDALRKHLPEDAAMRLNIPSEDVQEEVGTEDG